MKRLYIAILITICGMTAMAQDRPDINHQTTGRDRDGIITYAMMLTPVYDEPYVEVYGCENNYYDVTVSTGRVIDWYGIIGKEYGTVIDYEFSSTMSYVITVTSSQGSTVVWRLENGVLNGSKMPWGGITDLTRFDQIPLFDR